MFKFLLVFIVRQVKNWRFRSGLGRNVGIAHDKVFAGWGCFFYRNSVCLIYIFDYLRTWKNIAAKTLTGPPKRSVLWFQPLLAFFKFEIWSIKSDELSRHMPIFEQECNGSFLFKTSSSLTTLFDWWSPSDSTWHWYVKRVLGLIEGHLTAIFKKIQILIAAFWENFARLAQLASKRYCGAWIFKREHILLLLSPFGR